MASPETEQSTVAECLRVLLSAQMASAGVPEDAAKDLTRMAVNHAANLNPLSPDATAELIYAFMDVMTVPCGALLHTTLLSEIAAGRVQIADTLKMGSVELRKIADPQPPRKRAAAHLYGAVLAARDALQAAGALPQREDGAALDDRYVGVLVKELERNAYNAVVLRCASRDPTVMRSWGNSTFMSYYRQRISVLYGAINPESSLVVRFGMEFASRLLSGCLDPAQAGKLSAREIHPEGYKREQEIIDVRRSQKIKQKVSRLFRCPSCKSRSSEYREVQDRSADEPASIYCKCLVCGERFQAA